MPLREQIAVHTIPQRASRPNSTTEDHPSAATHRGGHYAGIHPEDQPYQTRQPARQQKQPAPPYEDDVLDEPRLPSSTRRYPTTKPPAPQRARLNGLAFLLMALGVVLLGVVFALAIVEIISPALQNWQDTSKYGYPRTTHARENTGHGDPAHPYSDYIGVNLKCSLYVVELGEGDPGKQVPHLYYIAHFIGKDCDLIAITSITFADENGDGKVDMLIVANNTLYILYNDGTQFKLSGK